MSSGSGERRAIGAGEPGEGTGLAGAAEAVADARRATVAGGSNLSRVRAHNERLVLSLLRDESLSRAQIARRTGLSAQTISLIVRALEADGLVAGGAPVKGRVGQPSVPLALVADGAWFAGLKIGRRSAELVLIDFGGTVVASRQRRYRWPDPDAVARFVESEWPTLARHAPRERLHGLGIALPFELWQWHERLGAPLEVMRRWGDERFAEALGARLGLPVFVENDMTAACGAELTFGEGHRYRDFAYFFVGHFIGGGIVLDASVHAGPRGNAAAFGSLPVRDPERPGEIVPLIDAASLHVLESMLPRQATTAEEPDLHDAQSPQWSRHRGVVARWERRAGVALAMASVAVASVAEIEAVIIDGAVPADVRAALCARTREALPTLDTRGIERPRIVEGSIGAGARTLGAARLPLFARFLLDRGVLTRTGR